MLKVPASSFVHTFGIYQIQNIRISEFCVDLSVYYLYLYINVQLYIDVTIEELYCPTHRMSQMARTASSWLKVCFLMSGESSVTMEAMLEMSPNRPRLENSTPSHQNSYCFHTCHAPLSSSKIFYCHKKYFIFTVLCTMYIILATFLIIKLTSEVTFPAVQNMNQMNNSRTKGLVT